MTDSQIILEKLAAMEIVCLECTGSNDCKCTHKGHVGIDGLVDDCPYFSARFPLARMECEKTNFHGPEGYGAGHRDRCKGWYVVDLDEVRLEDVLVAIGTNWELYPHNKTTPYICVDFIEDGTAEGKDIEGTGDTPTEAALNALLQRAAEEEEK